MSTAIENKRKSIRNQLAQQTYNEVLAKLKEHKKCMLIRPTGFGKTYLLAHLTKKFKKALYMYPLDIIKLDVKTKYKDIVSSNTRFMSYKKLINLYKADINNMVLIANKYDLIICDEAHMAGADLTSTAMEELMRVGKDNYFVGATATPDRSDSFDVTIKLFNDVTISEYTLHNAIEDGLITKPYYVYSIYEAAGSLKELKAEVKKLKDESKRKTMLDKLTAVEVEMGNILNADSIIKETIDNVHKEIDYMKFIVFFSEKVMLDVKKVEVEKWFQLAYTNMIIRNLTITSDSEYAKNIHNLDDMKYQSNTIDLIYCIDMLNMGYHIEDLTGIVMLRGTSSNIIYKQQVGRCLSVASTSTPIIFDFVNNIFKKPYYGTYANDKDVNKDEMNTRGSRLNSLTIKDLIINDKTASFRQFIDKAVYDVGQMKLEEAIYAYVYRSAPMKELVKMTRLREDYIRSEFTKLGITMDD